MKAEKPTETIDFFSDPEFKFLRNNLDAQLKNLYLHGDASGKKQG